MQLFLVLRLLTWLLFLVRLRGGARASSGGSGDPTPSTLASLVPKASLERLEDIVTSLLLRMSGIVCTEYHERSMHCSTYLATCM